MKTLLLLVFMFILGMAAGRYYGVASNKDIVDLANGYGTMFNMCEQKYQAALKGDVNTATLIKEDMDNLRKNMDKLIKQYTLPTPATEDSYLKGGLEWATKH